jgi:antitoxin component YwqK of YwqJK toxin-antitoxin module
MKLNLQNNIIFCLLITCAKLSGQEIATIFYTQNWEITSANKATYYRFAFLNSSRDFFEGKFTDFSVKDKKMIASGEYLSNQKNGEFIKYFENGDIEQKGNYKYNCPSGRWYYYYLNGQLKMIIDFDEKDFKFIEYRDTSNNILLLNGTGKWEAEVNVYGFQTKLTATFKNGERNGNWVYIAKDGKKILNEVYRNSEFKSSYGYDEYGKRMFSQPYFNSRYFLEPIYNTVEQMVCEKDFNVNFSSLNWVKKILNFTNTQNISYLNSNLPADQILFINEDSQGNSWIGTGNNGLIKYDSIFTFYNKNNTPIKNNYISCLQIDNNGKIWFSFKSPMEYSDINTAGLACLSNNEIVIYNTENSGLTSNGINDIAVDRNNKKWFATENCIISYDDSTMKWEKHYNRESEIRKVDTIKYKNKDQYIRNEKKINSVTNSWEQKTYHRNYKSYNTQNEPTERHSSTITYYESPIDFYVIDILPTNEKIINSIRNGCCIYNDMSWECDSSESNLKYVELLLTKKFKIEKDDSLQYMNQLSKIMRKNMILQLITGIDNSLWVRTDNNIFKVTRTKIIEFDLFDENIKYTQDGNLKSKFYYLNKDKNGSIWVCINSAILKIE